MRTALATIGKTPTSSDSAPCPRSRGSHIRAMWRACVMAVLLAGCVQSVSATRYGAIPATEAGPAHIRVLGRVEPGQEVHGSFEAEQAAGFVITAAQGATVAASVTGVPAEVLFYGPLTPDTEWERVPILARGQERIAMTAPQPATYLVAVRSSPGVSGSFALSLRCVSGDCGVECEPDGACPSGSSCAHVECIRAPCPSYCHADVEPR